MTIVNIFKSTFIFQFETLSPRQNLKHRPDTIISQCYYRIFILYTIHNMMIFLLGPLGDGWTTWMQPHGWYYSLDTQTVETALLDSWTSQPPEVQLTAVEVQEVELSERQRQLSLESNIFYVTTSSFFEEYLDVSKTYGFILQKKRLKCDDVQDKQFNAILKQFYILKLFYFCSVFYKVQTNLIKNTNIIIF